MCILAIQYQPDTDTPVLVAANREEAYDRTALTPSIQSGKPRILCGIDQRSGGLNEEQDDDRKDGDDRKGIFHFLPPSMERSKSLFRCNRYHTISSGRAPAATIGWESNPLIRNSHDIRKIVRHTRKSRPDRFHRDARPS